MNRCKTGLPYVPENCIHESWESWEDDGGELMEVTEKGKSGGNGAPEIESGLP